jgi:hypothetical protein
MTFYEQVGIVIPGSVLLVGLLFYFPALNLLLAKDGVTLGQFGIFLLLSYGLGHLLAAVGNALEWALWKVAGGMPTDWVIKVKGTSLLSSAQIQALATKVTARLGIKIENIVGMDRKAWFPISRQIYADVAKNGKPDRIETFNGNYGLNRGLAAATLVLAAVSTVEGKGTIAAAFILVAVVYGYRAFRFARYYAREMYVQFLVLS